MSAFASVKLAGATDGVVKTTSATVGVDATYDPVGYVAPGVARWENRAAGIAVGFPVLTMSVRPPSKTSRVYKVTSKLSIPTLEQTSASTSTGIQPAPTRAYDCAIVIEALLPERSTRAERVILLSQALSLFAGTVTASDGSPTDSTGSPMISAIYDFDRPF